MRGVYTAYTRISANTAAKTLAYITAASTHVVAITSASVTNESNENNEQILCVWQRITTLGTPTATTLTPSKQESGDQAAACTVKGNVTASEPTYTANTEIGGEGAASLNGWFYNPAPEERCVIPPSASMGLRLINAMTAADLVVRITFMEIG
jgi:hypothetical protein